MRARKWNLLALIFLPASSGTGGRRQGEERAFYQVPGYGVFYGLLTRMEPETFAALLGEDGSRRRHANLLANVALLRSALLGLLAEHHPDQPLPELLEHFHSHPARCLNLLNS